MKEQIIHLEPHDDIASAKDKLAWVRAPRVLVVFPQDPRSRILQRSLDLVLLQREATRLGAQIALITADPVVMENAKSLRIAHFPSVDDCHKHSWRTAKASLSLESETRGHRLNRQLAEAASRSRSKLPPSPVKLTRQSSLTIVLISGLIVLLVAMAILPGARIEIVPASNQVTVTTTILADPAAQSVDVSAATVPARIVGVEVEGSASIESTGITQQPSEKARGVVRFTNLVPEQVSILPGTVVRTSAAAQPVRFITLEAGTLPAEVGATVDIGIEALEPGYSGNLPSARINVIEGPLATRLAVANVEPTRGGDVRDVTSISAEDYARLRDLVLQQLKQRAFAEMQTSQLIGLQQSEFVAFDSLTVVLIDTEVYQGVVGEVRDEVGLTMQVTIQGVAIDERLARQVVYSELAQKVGPGYQISPESLIYRRGEVTQFDEERRVTFIMQGAGNVATWIDPAKTEQSIRGMPIGQAVRKIEAAYPLAASPTIETWPSFWPLIPLLPIRIDLQINGQS